MEMSAAFVAFRKNHSSIASLVRCADVYGLHALSAHRGEQPNVELIQKVVTQGGVSSLARSWQFYMKKDEYDSFGERGHLRAICEHVVFASYVALESYLIGKFWEYFKVRQRSVVCKKVSLRSLDEIKRHYSKFLDINIAHFEPPIGVYEEAPWFHPASCWEGLKMLERCRHSLAHTGEMTDVKLVVLVDAWSAFEFCRKWVEYFEGNYNDHIHHNKPARFEEPV